MTEKEKVTNVALIFHLDSSPGVRDPWATLSQLKGPTVRERSANTWTNTDWGRTSIASVQFIAKSYVHS